VYKSHLFLQNKELRLVLVTMSLGRTREDVLFLRLRQVLQFQHLNIFLCIWFSLYDSWRLGDNISL